MPAGWALLALMGWAVAALAAPPSEPGSFELEREGEVFNVKAEALLAARPEEVWQVLTDYDHIARFVPGMSSSRVIEGPDASADHSLVVEQKGALGWSLLPLDFVVDLRVTEHPLERIDIERISGSGRQYRAVYLIEPVDSRQTRLEFRALIESDRFIPPLLGTQVLRSSLSKQFDALLREVERRHVP